MQGGCIYVCIEVFHTSIHCMHTHAHTHMLHTHIIHTHMFTVMLKGKLHAACNS